VSVMTKPPDPSPALARLLERAVASGDAVMIADVGAVWAAMAYAVSLALQAQGATEAVASISTLENNS